jgi:cardiolipin synthase A/B
VSRSSLIHAAADAARSESAPVLLELATALENGDVGLDATARVLQARLGIPTSRLGPIRRLLSAADDSKTLGLIVRAAVLTAERVRGEAPTVEIAATRLQRGGRVRTTGGVAREIVEGAVSQLLVVGYRVTTDAALAGLAAKTVAAIGAAAARGVAVTAVIHKEEANRAALLRPWPDGAPPPKIYTWPEQPEEPMAKMHAKVLVADGHDALVTSANLTRHGLGGNVEMGVRIIGSPARIVADVFERLIGSGEFVTWSAESG